MGLLSDVSKIEVKVGHRGQAGLLQGFDIVDDCGASRQS